MNTPGLTRGRPKGRSHWCIGCGRPAVTPAEERILVAIYTAPGLVAAGEIATVSRTTVRTVRRAAAELPSFIARLQTQSRETLYWLTRAGLAAIETLARAGGEAAQ